MVSPTPSVSVSTPRSEAPSIHSVLDTVPSEHGEEPIEDLEWDIDQLLQILQDMDQARGEDAQNLKEHMNHIEDGLRNLADFVRRQPPPPASVPEAQPRVEMPTPIIIQLEPVQKPVL